MGGHWGRSRERQARCRIGPSNSQTCGVRAVCVAGLGGCGSASGSDPCNPTPPPRTGVFLRLVMDLWSMVPRGPNTIERYRASSRPPSAAPAGASKSTRYVRVVLDARGAPRRGRGKGWATRITPLSLYYLLDYFNRAEP